MFKGHIMTIDIGDRVTVTYPPTYNRKREMVCSGVVRGMGDKEYVVKLDNGAVVYPKKEMVERCLI